MPLAAEPVRQGSGAVKAGGVVGRVEADTGGWSL